MNTRIQRLSIKKLTLNEMLETQSGENIVYTRVSDIDSWGKKGLKSSRDQNARHEP